MFCTNCGSQVRPGSRFCTKCGKVSSGGGSAVNQMEIRNASAPRSVANTFGQIPKHFIIIGCVAILAVVAFGGTLMFNARFGASLAVGRAMSNLNDEISQRLSTTPFLAVEMLYESLDRGTTNVNFAYREERRDWWSGRTYVSTGRGEISLVSNQSRSEAALFADLTVDGNRFGFNMLVDRNRMAFHSPQVSPNYYGFRFNTFRNDFDPFARILELNRQETDQVSDFVEELGRSIQRSQRNGMGSELDEYTRAFINFMLDAEEVDERAYTIIGGQEVRARRVAYTVTERSAAELFWTWLRIFETDDYMRSMFDSPFWGMGTGGHWDTVREIRNAINEFERDFRGEVTAAFYIGARNRLLKIDVAGDMRFEGENLTFYVNMDFGSSATDTWMLEAGFRTQWDNENVRIVWTTREIGNRNIHDLDVFMSNGDTFNFTSEWNTASGDFSFRYSYRDRWSTNSGELLRGNFTTSGRTFRLSFDWEDGGNHLTMIISTETGASIPNVGFINIDRWDRTLIDRLENALLEIGF